MLGLLASLVMLGRQCFVCPCRLSLSNLESIEVSAYDCTQYVFVHHASFAPFVKISGVQVYGWLDEVLKLCAFNIVLMQQTRDHSILASR